MMGLAKIFRNVYCTHQIKLLQVFLSLTLTHGEMYAIQPYVIKVVSN